MANTDDYVDNSDGLFFSVSGKLDTRNGIEK